MNELRIMYAVNIFLVIIVAAFCIKYNIIAKIISRITLVGGGAMMVS